MRDCSLKIGGDFIRKTRMLVFKETITNTFLKTVSATQIGWTN